MQSSQNSCFVVIDSTKTVPYCCLRKRHFTHFTLVRRVITAVLHQLLQNILLTTVIVIMLMNSFSPMISRRVFSGCGVSAFSLPHRSSRLSIPSTTIRYLTASTTSTQPLSSPSSSSTSSSSGRTSAAVAQKAKEFAAATAGGSTTKPPATEFNLSPPRGTRDFYPEDQRLKNWLFTIWKDTAMKYGFEEYDAPIVEHAELYIRKAGEEVTQQLYDFHDKGKRHLSLRPEMTPSLARMVLAKKNMLSFPLKWFAIPQCWRYERTTRGRRR